MKNRLSLLLVFAVGATLTALLIPPALAQSATDGPVAIVNGEKIGQKAFLATLEARYGERVLNSLIIGAAVRQAAHAAGVTVSQDELDSRFVAAERVVEMRAPLTGMNFEMFLAERQLTPDYFRTELYNQMLLEKMVQSQVKVTTQDVSDFYQSHKDELRQPAMMHVAHICVNKLAQAKQIRADILAKKIDWNDAVKKYSIDPWTKDTGGDLNFIPDGNSPFNQAAFALTQDDQISEPVRTDMGYHLIKRLGFRDARIPPYEEIEATLRDELEHDQLRALASAKRDSIMKAAKIQDLLKVPSEPAPPATPSPATTTKPAATNPAAPAKPTKPTAPAAGK